jgi:hypothetical protein
MLADGRAADEDRDRLFAALERLLALEATEVGPALEEAADRIAEALGADKVDVFLLDPSADALVAVGTSDTRMGRRLAVRRGPAAGPGRRPPPMVMPETWFVPPPRDRGAMTVQPIDTLSVLRR